MRVYSGMNRRTACLLSFSFAVWPGFAAAQPPEARLGTPKTAEELFAQLSTLTGLEATFVETKTMALLRVPLRSEGTLFYMRPGHLLRQVTRPKPSRVLITPDRLELSDSRGARTMDLRSRPDVKLFVESFLKVLAGDRAALAKVFDIQFARNTPPPSTQSAGVSAVPEWTLTLTPKAEPLNHIVRKLSLSGNGYAVQRIEVVETKGDQATTELHVKEIGRTFSDEEKLTLFGIAAAPSTQ